MGAKILVNETLLSYLRKVVMRRSSDHRNYSTVGNRGSSKTEVAETREAILRNTEITRAHLTPEIRLHLLTPNCTLYHAPVPTSKNLQEHNQATIATFRDPFWSIYWPGGQALTRFVLDRGEELFSKGTGRTILDLGAGCGATAIAAKLRGAHAVVANDIDPVACVATDMNAGLNGIRLTTTRDNLLAKPYAEPFDVIFVGDLLYDEEIAILLEPWLDEALHHGARIYLGDPGRHGITENLRRRLKKLQTYPLPQNVRQENYGFDSATVWQFLKIAD